MFSCGSIQDDGRIKEGEIEFEVSYPKMTEDNFMIDFMPDVMILQFKDNKYMSELSAGAGMFKSSFIADSEQKEFIQMVKLISKKMYVKLNEEGVKEMNAEMPAFEVEQTTETKEIAGYNCKRVIIHSSNGESFDAFYTDEINIPNANWCTQYKDIPGVLLEYQLEKYDICMRLQAVRVAGLEIEDETFNYENDYKLVSRQRIDKELQEIFDSFNQ